MGILDPGIFIKSLFSFSIFYRGGVMVENRICQSGSDCTGPTKRFSSCNLQECPGSPDIRLEQCSRHSIYIRTVIELASKELNHFWGDRVVFPKLGTGDTDRWHTNKGLFVTCKCPWSPISKEQRDPRKSDLTPWILTLDSKFHIF